jgi:hypothetical protein
MNRSGRENDTTRISRLEILVADMQQSINQIGHMIGSTKINVTASQTKEMKDKVWFCDNCGARIGIYATDSDELRIRYKEHIVYVVPGDGGRVSVPCRRCSKMNTLEGYKDQ